MSDYWDSVQSIAEDIFADLEIKSVEDYDANHNEVCDRVTQDVDSSQWVIYTSRNYDVLKETRNRDAYEDVGLDTSNGFDAIVTQVAFFAMERDVWEAIESLKDDLPESREEEEEEETTEESV